MTIKGQLYMNLEDNQLFRPVGIANKAHYAAKRFIRMSRFLLARRITLVSFKISLRTNQRAVCQIGGGMIFCDYDDEAAYFCYEDM